MVGADMPRQPELYIRVVVSSLKQVLLSLLGMHLDVLARYLTCTTTL